MCINGKSAYMPVENVSNCCYVAITSHLRAFSGVGFIGTCLIRGRFLCGSWQVQAAYFVMKSDTSSNRPRFGTLLCTNFFTPLESPTGTALMA